jgi:hypothetical protein
MLIQTLGKKDIDLWLKLDCMSKLHIIFQIALNCFNCFHFNFLEYFLMIINPFLFKHIF